LLRERGDWLYILELQGFLFFGTVNTLVARVRARLADTSRAKPHFIVVDFRRVSGLDASSVLALGRMVHLAQAYDATLVVTHLSDRCRRQLARDVFVGEAGDHWRIFSDLDHGLEWCEDRLIEVFEAVGLTATPRKGAPRLEDTLTRAGRLGALIDFLEEAGAPPVDPLTTLVQALASYMERQEVEAGALLVRAGETPRGLYVLEAGSFAVEVLDRQGRPHRVRKLQAGTIVGEGGLYSHARAAASVVAQAPGIVALLSRENLQTLEREDPALAAAFHKFIAQRMSERVADVTTTLRALLD
jgi:SulP family sulfate permease